MKREMSDLKQQPQADILPTNSATPYYKQRDSFPTRLISQAGHPGLYVDAGTNVPTGGAFSAAMWVKLNNNGSNQTLFGDRLTDSGLRGVLLHNGSNYDPSFINEDSGGTVISTNATAQNYAEWIALFIVRSATGQTNFVIGNKTSTPTNQSDTINANTGTPTKGTENMIFAATAGGVTSGNFDGYLLYQLMYAEDLSAANTDLEKIEKIWTMTKDSIPE